MTEMMVADEAIEFATDSLITRQATSRQLLERLIGRFLALWLAYFSSGKYPSAVMPTCHQL
ncbi:hypothetical protein [Chamaesiphon minutus]|uniref:hypothetical protein n=1 Tax=Chamaesiphon minutus TaxID=1173032 RepID=UPI00059F384E|nr:hypothetical protein [Chamaesiphon minutus]